MAVRRRNNRRRTSRKKQFSVNLIETGAGLAFLDAANAGQAAQSFLRGDINGGLNTLSSAFKSPLIICCAAEPALAASKNAKPAPVSNKFIEKDRFLRADLFFRLTTIFILCGGDA